MELHVIEREGRKTVVLLDNEMRIVKPVYDYLKFQRQKDKALNTLKASGSDLRTYWEFLNDNGYEYDKANKDKCVAGLCDGYCTKPVTDGNICPRLLKRQKCYTCSRYITTPEYLEAHKQHLANLEKQLEEGAIYGEHYAEHFIPTIEVLKFIIERLEGLQNGN